MISFKKYFFYKDQSAFHPSQSASAQHALQVSSSLSNLSAVLSAHHTLNCHNLSSLPIEIGNGRRHYQCPICLKTFSEKGNMKRHTQIHLQQRNRYMCDLCSKCFSWKD